MAIKLYRTRMIVRRDGHAYMGNGGAATDRLQFDAVAKRLARTTTRRGAFGALAGGAGAVLLGPSRTDAAKSCVKVGKRCKHSAQCCSGICKGHKRRKTCRAHDVGTCGPQHVDLCSNLDFDAAQCNNDESCACFTTTGGARFCGANSGAFCPANGGPCKRDPDCGPGAACVKSLDDCDGCPFFTGGPTFCEYACSA